MKYYRIIFSPTGGTEKVANAITKNWKQIETIDLTLLDTDYAKISFEKDSLVLIAMPSFGGVAPSLALERLSPSIRPPESNCTTGETYFSGSARCMMPAKTNTVARIDTGICHVMIFFQSI